MTEALISPAEEAVLTDHHDRTDRARATLGVDGSGEVKSLRGLLRSSGTSVYPLGALGTMAVVDQFQGTAFTVAVPDIARTLGVGIGAVGIARTLTFLASVLAPLPIAALASSPLVRKGRIGRAMICIVTSMLWSLITLTTGFVTSLLALIAVLVFDGLSTGSVAALHPALMADSYPPQARVRIFAGYTQIGAFGSIISPLLVSVLAVTFDLTWRGVFLGLGLLSTGATLLCLGLKDPGVGRFDTALVRQEGSIGDTGHVDLGFFEIVRRLLLIPSVVRLLSGFAVFGILSVPLANFASFYIYDRFRLGLAERGIFFSLLAVVSIISLQVFARRGEALFARDPGQVINLSGSLLAVGVIIIGSSPIAPNVFVFFGFFALGSAVVAIMAPGLTSVLVSIVDADQRPHLAALIGLFQAFGSLFGLFFLSSVQTRFGIAGTMVSLIIPGISGALILRSARGLVQPDMDRMIESLLEEQDLAKLHASGGRLPMLACRGLNFSYGQLQVLFDIDFTVDQGEMVALLGTNGAGKSTLLKAVSGIGLPQSGTVRMEGHDITYLDAERRLRLGITQIPGGRAVFGPLNVIDNLRCFGYSLGTDRRTVDEAIDRCLAAFPRLDERKASLAATLSGGEQQMLGLSKALMLKPKLLLIDELSLGLAPVIVAQLLEMVRVINGEGTAVVLVEQSVNIALSLVDHAYFMEKGQMRFDGPAGELLGRDDLLRAVFLEGATKAQETVKPKPRTRTKAKVTA